MQRCAFVVLVLVALVNKCNGQAYADGQYSSSTQLYGVTYSPFALDLETMCLPVKTVLADMKIIKGIADHIRTYNLAMCPENMKTMLTFCKENGIRVVLGMHISEDLENNDAEMNALSELVHSYGDIVDAVIVGNKVLFDLILSLEQLVAYINIAKTIVADAMRSIPVATSEVWPVYESIVGPQLVRASDFLCMNHQPYWEGWDAICPDNVDYICASAGNYVHLKAKGLEDYFGKPAWICESGWPTEGERCCEGRAHARGGLLAGPHISNSTIVINELVLRGRNESRPTFVHAMFDEEWKRIWSPCRNCEGLDTQLEDPSCDTCEVDYHFGLFNSDRSPKGIPLPAAP